MKKNDPDNADHLPGDERFFYSQLVAGGLERRDRDSSEEGGGDAKMAHLHRTWQRILDVLRPECETHLVASPAIRFRVKRKLQEQSALSAQGPRSFSGYLMALLRIPIPLYRAALAGIAIIVTAAALGSFSNETEVDTRGRTTTMLLERPLTDSLTIINNIRRMENRKVGKNIREDSLLIRFIITSVDFF